MPVRLFTVDEANQVLARLDGLVERAQATTREMRSVRDQLVDLRIVWGDKVGRPDCPDHAEYTGYERQFHALEAQLESVTAEVAALGCELKDVENGLVDFQALQGEDVVYLCWKKGERRVAWWHPLEGGFAARRPLSSF